MPAHHLQPTHCSDRTRLELRFQSAAASGRSPLVIGAPPGRGQPPRTIAVLFLVIATLFGGGVPLAAHHSFAAEFDATAPITLSGTLSLVRWVNPHASIQIRAIRQIQMEEWTVELSAPNSLRRSHVGPESLAVGTTIIVEGYRSRSGRNIISARALTLPDGRKIWIGSSGAESAAR